MYFRNSDALCIDNITLEGYKEKLYQIPVQFIAYVDEMRGDFILVTDTRRLLHKRPHFLEQWNGVAVVAEKPEFLDDPENEKSPKKKNS